jgi:hypothetical protein
MVTINAFLKKQFADNQAFTKILFAKSLQSRKSVTTFACYFGLPNFLAICQDN